MASYTDKIPQFNPYVAQQPVDAMVKVGMAKQGQYDTNVQKIQQSMSNIAGLQVGRDVDKDYLQKKMAEMTKQLRPMAFGDFSSNQLTSSVRGMIGGIANDETVQNSVRSAMKAQSSKKLQGKYNAEGKGSPSNDWLLNTDLEKWYNNPDAGAVFNSDYKPYTDYNQNALKIVKEVLKDENITDKDFYIDDKGQVQFTDVMVRTKLAGKSRAKVQSALMGALTPGDWEQISIDGRYQYSNISGEDFKKEINSSFTNNLSKLKKEKIRLEENYNVSSSSTAKRAIQGRILEIDKAISSDEQEFKTINDYFSKENYEGAKAKLFTTNWMNNMSNSFSSVEHSETMHTSPRAEFKFKRNKETRRRQEWTWSETAKERRWGADYLLSERNTNAKELANRISLGGLASNGYGPVLNPKEQSTLYKASPEKLQLEIDATKEKLREEKGMIASYYTMAEDDFKAKISTDTAFLAAVQKSTNTAEPTYEDYVNGFIADQEKLYEVSPGKVKTKFREFLENKQVVDRVLKTKEKIKEKALTASNKKYDLTKILQDIDKEHKYYYQNDASGEDPVTFTAKDILTFEEKYREIKQKINFMSSTGTEFYDPYNLAKSSESIVKLTQFMTPSEKKMLQIRMNEDSDLGGFARILDPWEQEMSNSIKTVLNKYDDNAKKVLAEKAQFESDYVANKLSNMQGQSHSIDLNDYKPANGGMSMKDQFQAVIYDLATNADLRGLMGTSITGETLEKIAEDLTSASLRIEEGVLAEEEDKYVLRLSGGGLTETVILDKDNYESVFKGKYERDPLSQRFLEYRQKIQAENDDSTFIGSTSEDGKVTNTENAYLKNNDFPSASVGISGNLVTKDGVYYDLELNIFDPIEKKWVENIEYTNKPQLDVNLQNQMLNLSDEAAFELLYDRVPEGDELKQFKELLTNLAQ